MLRLARPVLRGVAGRAVCRRRTRNNTAPESTAAHAARLLPTPPSASPSSSPSLAHLPPDIRPEVSRALELADRASSSWSLAHTDFLSPPAAGAALAALAGRADVGAVAWGGWAGAERVRLVLGQPDRLADLALGDGSGGGGGEGEKESGISLPPPPGLADPGVGGVAAVALRGRFTFEAASHRDFLGATLHGAGLDRRVLGDILLDGERGATLFCVPGVVAAIERGVTGVRGVRVVATAVTDPADLRLPAPPRPPAPVSTTEASLRLDAIASAGFRTSRAKMVGLIKGGDVRLNWVPTTRGSAPVAAGDVISCSGKGRVEVVEVGLTKKGRWAVQLLRFA